MIKYKMRLIGILILLAQFVLAADANAAGSYVYDPQGNVVGLVRHHIVGQDETFYEVARLYGLGYNEMESANAGINPWVPGVGKSVIVPTKWVLPSESGKFDIIVNLAEMRIYRFFNSEGRDYITSYPIGVAIEGFYTPQAEFSISDKIKEPNWYVPDSVRQQNPELPKVVLPGADNPLGKFALRLSDTAYFIHGTNKPLGIGKRVSHGCIRLYPEDIEQLFSLVRLGERVSVVYEPVKLGIKSGRVYLEVHDDYLDLSDLDDLAHKLLEDRGLQGNVDPVRVATAIEERSGVPVVIGEDVVVEVMGAETRKTPEAKMAPGIGGGV